jgi:EAL domain-containing protein (putative c-di-GMP-specific phosphodiesterase class I)
MELPSDSPRKVLIVDDDDDILREFSKLLTREGFETVTASNGTVALEKMGLGPFEVILTDLNMPFLGGLDFLRAVRIRDLDVPVLLITGVPGLDTAMQAIEYGAFQYLTKPVDPERLLASVSKAAKVHALSRLRRLASTDSELPALRLPDRASFEARFASALDRLWIAFQPIVRWSNETIFSYEALVRSDEPSLGNPGALFDCAAQLGRTMELGRVIRARVAEVAKTTPNRVIFINLNPEDLNDPELYSSDAPLSEHAPRVVLEITERAGLERVSGLSARLTQLRRRGFRVAIDDLGAGYSSLASFVHLEPDFVKLDMSLIRDVHLSARKRTLTKGIAQICASDLGIQVVCEGVETAEERDCLCEQGLDLLQGYLFGRPSRPFVEVDFRKLRSA